MGEIQFAFFHPREMENHETQGTKTEKIPYSLSALFCTDPRSSKFSFFSYHLEFINLESIILEFKDLIRKFVQININLIFV